MPEYNYSIAAPLKNAIDWLSRARDESGKTPFDSKKITLVSAAGRMGGSRAQYHLRQVFVFLKGDVVNDELNINAFAGEIFDGEGNLVDEDNQGRVKKHIESFVSSLQ